MELYKNHLVNNVIEISDVILPVNGSNQVVRLSHRRTQSLQDERSSFNSSIHLSFLEHHSLNVPDEDRAVMDGSIMMDWITTLLLKQIMRNVTYEVKMVYHEAVVQISVNLNLIRKYNKQKKRNKNKKQNIIK